MSRPVLLDLFCGAGGAARGYQQAGFHVVGVDHRPQSRYAGEQFIQADALDFLADADLTRVGAVHASPPCQRFTALAGLTGRAMEHPDLLTPTLALLARTAGGVPILYQLIPPCRHNTTPVGVYGHPGGTSGSPDRRSRGDVSYSKRASLATWKTAMGIDWMTAAELAQAIPPACTDHIGRQLYQLVVTPAGRRQPRQPLPAATPQS